MRPVFAVIIALPKDPAMNHRGGVLVRKASGYWYEGSAYPGQRLGPYTKMLLFKAPAFNLGEIIILESRYGREVGWPGRDPSKWFTLGKEYQVLSSLTEAIQLAQQVLAKTDDFAPA